MAQSHRKAIPSLTISAASSKCDEGTENSKHKQDQIDYVSLCRAVLTRDSESARAIFDVHPGAVTAQLAGTTALHAAVADRSFIQLVKYLVDPMAPDSLKRRDAFGRTALHVAAMAGNTEAANILVEKNPGLLHQRDKDEELPLHLAARHARYETVWCLLSVRHEYPEGVFSGPSGFLLRGLLISADFYDIALEVLRRLLALLPDLLSRPWELRDLEETFYVLATRPEAFARRHYRHRFCLSAPHHFLCNSEHYMKKHSQYGFFQKSTDRAEFEYPHAIDLLRLLIGEILKTGQESATDILGRQLCAAAQFGNYEAVVEILRAHPILLLYTRPYSGHRHGFLQVAVMNGQERVFDLICQLGSLNHHLLHVHESRDGEGNNILHLAARRQPSSTSSAALQVQRDLQWFKKVERNVPPSFREQANIQRRTPREVFAGEHKELLKEGDDWMKKSAESCSVVAALVVTVVFAAAFTVPGGNNDSNGIPNYLTDASFMTFAISDALGLVSSITSLLMFLSILISGFEEEEDLLNPRRYKRLGIGLVILFFSIASMLVTFTASLQIVLDHRVKWIAVPIGIFASVPVILFATLQFPISFQIIYSTFRSIFFAGEKVACYPSIQQIFPGRKARSCFRCCS